MFVEHCLGLFITYRYLLSIEHKGNCGEKLMGLVVRRMDKAIHQIHLYLSFSLCNLNLLVRKQENKIVPIK